MRVIAGTARSLSLKTIEGLDTRPTTDRIKETLFNMIQGEILNCHFLDLYSGSGAIGIEALSRGAKIAYFVENSKAAIQCIKDNLRFTKLDSSGIVMECSTLTAISKLQDRGVKFHIIFMDPPYNHEYEKEVLKMLANSSIVTSESLIIVEASLDTNFGYIDDLGLSIIKIKKYKTNKHVFITRER